MRTALTGPISTTTATRICWWSPAAAWAGTSKAHRICSSKTAMGQWWTGPGPSACRTGPVAAGSVSGWMKTVTAGWIFCWSMPAARTASPRATNSCTRATAFSPRQSSVPRRCGSWGAGNCCWHPRRYRRWWAAPWTWTAAPAACCWPRFPGGWCRQTWMAMPAWTTSSTRPPRSPEAVARCSPPTAPCWPTCPDPPPGPPGTSSSGPTAR